MVETPAPSRAEARPMTAAEREECVRMFRAGKGVREIARHFGRAPSTISRTLRAAGLSASRAPAAGRPGKSAASRPRAATSRTRTAGKAAARGGASATARRSATGRGRAGGRSTASGRATPTTSRSSAANGVTRREMRRLEQRITRIENSLSQMRFFLQRSTRGARSR